MKDDVDITKQARENQPIKSADRLSWYLGLGKRSSTKDKIIMVELEDKCRESKFLTKRQKAIADVIQNK